MIDIKITAKPLDVTKCLKKVSSPKCGGTALFIGSVREETDSKKVIQLEYEAYKSMAEKELRIIADHVIKTWSVEHIVIHHRIGTLGIGEISVVIATSAPHRHAALEACTYSIDTLKQTVPIWKKEVFVDGETWVAAHP